MNTTTELFIFELHYVSNFSTNWQFSFLELNIPKKGVSSLKQMKTTPPLSSANLNKSKLNFLAGGDALVSLAELMHKKYSTKLICGHAFSTHVSYVQC